MIQRRLNRLTIRLTIQQPVRNEYIIITITGLRINVLLVTLLSLLSSV